MEWDAKKPSRHPEGLPTFEELEEKEELMKEVSTGSGGEKTREECMSERCFNHKLRSSPIEERSRKRKMEKGTNDSLGA